MILVAFFSWILSSKQGDSITNIQGTIEDETKCENINDEKGWKKTEDDNWCYIEIIVDRKESGEDLHRWEVGEKKYINYGWI